MIAIIDGSRGTLQSQTGSVSKRPIGIAIRVLSIYLEDLLL